MPAKVTLTIKADQLPADMVKLAKLRAAIAEGIADIEAGRVVDGDEVFDHLLTKYRAVE